MSILGLRWQGPTMLCLCPGLRSSPFSCNQPCQQVSYLWELLDWKQMAYSGSHIVQMAGQLSQELCPHAQLHSDGSKHSSQYASGQPVPISLTDSWVNPFHALKEYLSPIVWGSLYNVE